MRQRRFNISFGDKRTSITVDAVLFELMAFKLGCRPDSVEAHPTVRKWLEETLVSRLGDGPVHDSASQWARVYLVEAVADRELTRQRDGWRLGDSSV